MADYIEAYYDLVARIQKDTDCDMHEFALRANSELQSCAKCFLTQCHPIHGIWIDKE